MKKYFRSYKDNKIGGVCGGLAEATDTDSTLWRIGFVVGLFTPLPILITYLLLWICIPKETNEEDEIGQIIKDMRKEHNPINKKILKAIEDPLELTKWQMEQEIKAQDQLELLRDDIEERRKELLEESTNTDES